MANDACRQPVELAKLKRLPGHRGGGIVPLVTILAGSGALLAVWLIATSGPSKSLPQSVEVVGGTGPPAISGDMVCDEPVWSVGAVDATNGKVSLEHRFTLRNLSPNRSIDITKVQTTCGCLAVDEIKAIEPQESIELPVTLLVAPREQAIRQRIVVHQTDQQPLVLSIVGSSFLNGQLQALPNVLNFGEIPRDSRRVGTFKVRRNNGSPLGLKSVSVDSPVLRAAVKRETATEAEIEVEFDAERAPPSGVSFDGVVLLQTEQAVSDKLAIRVLARLEREASGFVERVFVNGLEPGEAQEHALLEPASEAADLVDSVACAGDGTIQVTLVRDDAGAPRLRVLHQRDDSKATLVQGSIAVNKTDGTVIDIPITVVCVNAR